MKTASPTNTEAQNRKQTSSSSQEFSNDIAKWDW